MQLDCFSQGFRRLGFSILAPVIFTFYVGVSSLGTVCNGIGHVRLACFR